MIVVRLIGGLGNQMFQYACGRALGERLGTNVVFDMSGFRAYRLHRYGLDGFIGDVVKAPWHLSACARVSTVASRLHVSPTHLFKLLGIQWIHENGDLRYQPEKLAFEGPAYLDGYWQCARYFEDFETRTREDFGLTPSLSHMLRENLQLHCVGQGVTASIHIRRGDYVSDPSANLTHGTLGEYYYRSAFAYLTTQIRGDFRLLVFSDDIAWAQKNIHFPVETAYVVANARHPQVDMHLMASCDHHIIANSSFSWWGAWLNSSLSKTVIAPARWFQSDALCGDDICLPEWVRI